MNKLTVSLSFLTLLWLSVDLFGVADDEGKVANNKLSSNFYPPNSLSDALLAIEERWLSLQNEADKAQAEILAAKNKVVEPEIDESKLLSFDGKSYQLLGIFVTNTTPFILVKLLKQAGDIESNQDKKKKSMQSTRKSGVIQIQKGQEISPGITLSELTSNKIVLRGKNKTYEFKLFERSSNDKS